MLSGNLRIQQLRVFLFIDRSPRSPLLLKVLGPSLGVKRPKPKAYLSRILWVDTSCIVFKVTEDEDSIFWNALIRIYPIVAFR